MPLSHVAGITNGEIHSQLLFISHSLPSLSSALCSKAGDQCATFGISRKATPTSAQDA